MSTPSRNLPAVLILFTILLLMINNEAIVLTQLPLLLSILPILAVDVSKPLSIYPIEPILLPNVCLSPNPHRGGRLRPNHQTSMRKRLQRTAGLLITRMMAKAMRFVDPPSRMAANHPDSGNLGSKPHHVCALPAPPLTAARWKGLFKNLRHALYLALFPLLAPKPKQLSCPFPGPRIVMGWGDDKPQLHSTLTHLRLRTSSSGSHA